MAISTKSVYRGKITIPLINQDGKKSERSITINSPYPVNETYQATISAAMDALDAWFSDTEGQTGDIAAQIIAQKTVLFQPSGWRDEDAYSTTNPTESSGTEVVPEAWLGNWSISGSCTYEVVDSTTYTVTPD